MSVLHHTGAPRPTDRRPRPAPPPLKGLPCIVRVRGVRHAAQLESGPVRVGGPARVARVVRLTPEDPELPVVHCTEGVDWHRCSCPKYREHRYTCVHLVALETYRVFREESKWSVTREAGPHV